MKHRGHPIRGAIAGLFFGLFVSLDLVIFGVLALDADLLAVFPLLGLAAGIALGLTAPLHRPRAETETDGWLAGEQPVERQIAEAPPVESAPSLASPEPDHSTV